MVNKTILIIVIVILVAGVGYYFMKANKTQQAMQTSTNTMTQDKGMNVKAGPTTATSPSQGVAMQQESNSTVKTLTVEGKNFSFSPSTLNVNKGDKVTIIFKNSGGMHDFVIDAYNVKTKQIGSGEQDTVTFTADKAGNFEYYCSVGNHRAMGMTGKLTVK